MDMMCRQCEQTAQGTGCTAMGACGKSPETAALHDALVYALEGISIYAHRAREYKRSDPAVDRFVIEGLFTVVTNVNFDPEKIAGLVRQAASVRTMARDLFISAYRASLGTDFAGTLPAPAAWVPDSTMAGLLKQAATLGIRNGSRDADIQSLRELLQYGLEGMAAYADHAWILNATNETVTAFFHKALSALADTSASSETLLDLVMELGRVNLACMELLDGAHKKRFGTPRPTPVALGERTGPAILVSGHDLWDLKQLLEQTEGTGIQIYTHGEMLPAHAYPELKKHAHLAGHYGTAWQNQHKEFAAFPGAILMTTNCIQKPIPSYISRIFTTGLVAFPGVTHIPAAANGTKDFAPLITAARAAGGFAADRADTSLTVGFMHDTVLGVADTVLAAAKSGALRHIFLVGGCDGAKPGRNYYTDFVLQTPKDTLVLTLACGKFRFNREDLGTLSGLPRLLDMGQCNDAYSAIKVAVELAKALKTDVNGLPLSLVLSWYEQKAVVILITLLSLGIKNIRLGPTLPAFVTPGILKFLVDTFGVRPISTPEKDLAEILGAPVA